MSDEPNEPFLGLPVDGNIIDNHRVEQKQLSELEPLIRAVLDNPKIYRFGWHQYTPYFNDGEPCIFRVGSVWFLSTADTDGGGDFPEDPYEYTIQHYTMHPSLGGFDGWESHGAKFVGDDRPTWDTCDALSVAVESAAFDDVLLRAFGDHADVSIGRDGIKVEQYFHD